MTEADIAPGREELARTVDLRGCFASTQRLPIDAWCAALLRPETSLAVHPVFVGPHRRATAWSCRGRRVDGHWLLHVLEGRGEAEAAGRSLTLEPGRLIWLNPGEVHAMHLPRGMRYTETYFALRSSSAERRVSRHLVCHDGLLEFKEASAVVRGLERLADEMQLAGPQGALRARALLSVLCIDVLRGAGSTGPTASVAAGADRPLSRRQQQQLVRFSREREHLVEPADLARQLGLSPAYFSRRFRATFGDPPRRWLHRRQIETAASLLDQTSMPVAALADRLGYAGVPQFSRQFKAVMGVAPAAYRRRSRPGG